MTTSKRLSRALAAVVGALAVSFGVFSSAAQAVVVDVPSTGPIVSAPFDSGQTGRYFGVAPVPGTTIPAVTSNFAATYGEAPACDPALAPQFAFAVPVLAGYDSPELLPGLCRHGGSVLHQQDIYAFYWDPWHGYFEGTKDYVDQFLQDVGNDSGKGSSPYAVTAQYTDSSGRAAHLARFRGAYTDFDSSYPGCTLGTECVLNDADVRAEITHMMQANDISPNTTPDGYAPLITLFTPPLVKVCLGSLETLCSHDPSAAASPSEFCSYHAYLTDPVSGARVPYVVQPWTAGTASPETNCDDPSVDSIPSPVDPATLAKDLGERLVSPTSQSQIAAIVNPFLDGWFATDGTETANDGCGPLPAPLDKEAVNGTPYVLQREFNNGGVIQTDPNSLECTYDAVLTATFVSPNAVNPGDIVQLDGSDSASTLVATSYSWDFGDGTTASGPSVVHSYSKPGAYAVKLTVTDRGGNVSTDAQTVDVFGAGGSVPTTGPNASGTSTSTSKSGLHASVHLLPVSFQRLLRKGVPLEVTTNESAAAIASVSISRKAAKRAHIKAGRGPAVVIGRGSLPRIVSGRIVHLRLPSRIVKKLRRLGHVTLTIKLTVVDGHGGKEVIDAAGRY